MSQVCELRIEHKPSTEIRPMCRSPASGTDGRSDSSLFEYMFPAEISAGINGALALDPARANSTDPREQRVELHDIRPSGRDFLGNA